MGCKITVDRATMRVMSNGCVDRMVVAMYGVKILNPPGFHFSTDTFASIGMVEMLFDPWTVKTPCVNMNCLHMDDIDLYLERNKNGLMNTKGVKLSAKRAEERILKAETQGEEYVSSDGEDDSDNEIIGDDEGDEFGMDFGGPEKQSTIGKATGRAVTAALAATATATAAAGPTVARMKDGVLKAVEKERKLLHGASSKIMEMAKGARNAANQLAKTKSVSSSGTGAQTSPGKAEDSPEGPQQGPDELTQTELKEQLAQLGINLEDYEKMEALWSSEDVVGPGAVVEDPEKQEQSPATNPKSESEDEFMDSREVDDEEDQRAAVSPNCLSRQGSKSSVDQAISPVLNDGDSMDSGWASKTPENGSGGKLKTLRARLTGKLQDKAKAALGGALEKFKKKVAGEPNDDASSVHSDEPPKSQSQGIPARSAFRKILRGGSFTAKSPHEILGSSPPSTTGALSQPDSPRSGSLDFQSSPEHRPFDSGVQAKGGVERMTQIDRDRARNRSPSPELPAAGSLSRQDSGTWMRAAKAPGSQESCNSSRGPSLELTRPAPSSLPSVPTINGVVKSIQHKILTEAKYAERPGARFWAIDLATVRHMRVHFNKLVDTLRSPTAADARHLEKGESREKLSSPASPRTQEDDPPSPSQRGSMESDRTEGEPTMLKLEDWPKGEGGKESAKQTDNGLNFDEPLVVDCVMITSEELKASTYAVRKDGIPAGELARRMKLKVRGELRRQNNKRLLRLAGGVGMMWLRKKVRSRKPKPSAAQTPGAPDEEHLRRRKLADPVPLPSGGSTIQED